MGYLVPDIKDNKGFIKLLNELFGPRRIAKTAEAIKSGGLMLPGSGVEASIAGLGMIPPSLKPDSAYGYRQFFVEFLQGRHPELQGAMRGAIRAAIDQKPPMPVRFTFELGRGPVGVRVGRRKVAGAEHVWVHYIGRSAPPRGGGYAAAPAKPARKAAKKKA